MSPVFDCTDSGDRDAGVQAAADAVLRGECIVLPTDTVYGIGADAFNPPAIQRLLEAKGRGRDVPPPVLIPSRRTVDGLAMAVPSYAQRLMDAFWPGGLTLVFRSQPSLAWDLGDTNGTVALRVPDDEIALAVLERTGPLAVSSANRHGNPAATTVTEAGFALGPAVEVYLDGGERTDRAASTVLDCTKPDPVVLRDGAITHDQLREVLAGVELITGDRGPDTSSAGASDHAASSASAVDLVKPQDHAAGGAEADPPADAEISDSSAAVVPGASLGAHWDQARPASDTDQPDDHDSSEVTP